ncbi:cDNA sequence BC021442, isoform CRA_a [Pelobates cultripes]|nr:cDNA sequence BC021442, isoform CRA_a [Pelobates cultripes]
MDEWEYLEGHKDLYIDVMMENHQTLGSPEDTCTSDGLHTSDSLSDFKTSESGHINKFRKLIKTKEKKTESIVNSTKESLSFEQNCPNIDTDTPTECSHIGYLSTQTAQESASCEEGNLAYTDMYTSTEHTQRRYPLNHIKEESSVVALVSHTAVYTPTRGKQIDYTSKYETRSYKKGNLRVNDIDRTTGHVNKESAVCNVSVTENHNYISPEPSKTEDVFGYNGGNLNSPGKYKTLLKECRKIDTNINPKSGKYLKNKQAISHRSVHPKGFNGNSKHVLYPSTLTRNEIAASEMENVFHTSDLTKHVPNNKQEKPFSCSECGKYFSAKRNLATHQTIHIGLKPFKCTECGKYFRLKQSLNMHRRIHTGEKPFECSECGKCFGRKDDLIKHQRIHKSEKPFKCSDCGKCFRLKHSLNVHRKIHSEEKPFECSECGKCFRLKPSLMVHQRIHTGERPFECSECMKCFGRKDELVKHHRIHTEEKPFECSECGKCFRLKPSLTVHRRIHTGERPFECSECFKCFKRKYELIKHQRIHKSERPFKCAECGKCFKVKHSLTEHQRIHTEEKPFECSECGKCFRQKGTLASHALIHTGEKPFECSECGKCYRLKYSLMRHQKVHKTENKPKGIL